MHHPLLYFVITGLLFSMESYGQTPAKPAKSSVQVRRGEYVRDVAHNIYGHTDYEGVMAVYNHLPARVGTFPRKQLIQTPPIKQIFREAKMDPVYMELIDEMIAVGSEFLPLAREYFDVASKVDQKALRLDPQKDAVMLPVPEETKAKVAALEQRLTAAQKKFVSRLKKGHVLPKSFMMSLDNTRGLLKGIASGVVDENCKTVDEANQRLGSAFTNALVWTQEGYQ